MRGPSRAYAETVELFNAAVNDLRGLIALGLWLAGMALMAYALFDASTKAAPLYPAAGKRTKPFWTILLLITTLAAFIVPSPLSLFFAVGVVAAAVYLTDVRPALRSVQGHGGGRHEGPYGPW